MAGRVTLPLEGDRMAGDAAREVFMALDDLKFSAAHFVAFKGFREPLHGHNYSVGVRAGGPSIQADGYLADFGDLKKVARKACKALNSRTLVPMKSDVLQIRRSVSNGGQLEISCEGGAVMVLPEQDCAMLPVIHTTAEELSEYLWWEILVTHNLSALLVARGVQWMEVSVSERPGQGAHFRALVARSATPEARQRPRAAPLPRPCFGFEEGQSCSADGCSKDCAESRRQQPVAVATSAAASVPSSGGYSSTEGLAPAGQPMSPEEVAEAAYKSLLSTLGPEYSSRPELVRTPYRAAKAWREMTQGLRIEDPLEVAGTGIFDVPEARDLVAIRDMPFHSMCEHHLLPFSGMAHVAYIPDGKVLGLSKFPRLLNVFARRLQLQERLSANFADAVMTLLQPRALAVALEATHACMCHRGVGVAASTRTLVLRGPGRDELAVKEQLLDGVSFSSGARARL
mmetsp:Transcript_28524/g.76209  ORF Transcript_28524/g.76209 Transcript_28524/m.76209 type:complete len:457 (+) Transcript_28524:47-1417(+)